MTLTAIVLRHRNKAAARRPRSFSDAYRLAVPRYPEVCRGQRIAQRTNRNRQRLRAPRSALILAAVFLRSAKCDEADRGGDH